MLKNRSTKLRGGPALAVDYGFQRDFVGAG
jgi:hypothetical protein